MNNLHRSQNGLLFLLFVFLLYCSYQSASAFFANLNFYAAKNIIEPLQSGESTVETSDLPAAKSAAEAAIALHSGLALYTDMLSTVKQWQALKSDNRDAALKLLDEAELLNLTSLETRPSWPVTWANLVYIKWEKREFDDDFHRYLKYASHYGPNTPEVHQVIATLGIYLYRNNIRVFLHNKDVLKTHILKGIVHPKTRRNVLKAIKADGVQQLVCSWSHGAYLVARKPLSCDQG